MRTRNPVVVLGDDGRPLGGANVQTMHRPSNTLASVYAKETGAEAGANPASTDEHGRVVQWLERGAYTSLITAEGMDAYSEQWDSAPGGDEGVDHDWLTVTLRKTVDTAATYGQGTHAARPSPEQSAAPMFYWETDMQLLFFNQDKIMWREMIQRTGGEIGDSDLADAAVTPPALGAGTFRTKDGSAKQQSLTIARITSAGVVSSSTGPLTVSHPELGTYTLKAAGGVVWSPETPVLITAEAFSTQGSYAWIKDALYPILWDVRVKLVGPGLGAADAPFTIVIF